MRFLYSTELNVPAKTAWFEMTDRFGDVGQWMSLLRSSHMESEVAVGGQRVCCARSVSLQAAERITKLDHKNMVLEYELIGGQPAFIKSGGMQWSVTALGTDRCRFNLRPEINLKPWAVIMAPFVRFGLNPAMAKVLEEFKHWVEKGEVHPRKRKALTRSQPA